MIQTKKNNPIVFLKRRIIFSIAMMSLVSLTLTFDSHATVVPTLESMVGRSNLVALGRVVKAPSAKARTRKVTIEIKQILIGAPEYIAAPLMMEKVKRTVFIYKKIGKVDIDFITLAKKKQNSIFFFKFVPNSVGGITDSFHLELSDVWFGVREAKPELLKKLEQINIQVRKIYDKQAR